MNPCMACSLKEHHQPPASPLNAVINQVREESFQVGLSVPDEKVLGVAIAKHLKWDLDKILEVAAAALEDANFHVEAAEIRDLGGPHGHDLYSNQADPS